MVTTPMTMVDTSNCGKDKVSVNPIRDLPYNEEELVLCGEVVSDKPNSLSFRLAGGAEIIKDLRMEIMYHAYFFALFSGF